ncbi:hypothetical protein MHYP_G00265030 [Metynnis hypsauchen]
MTSRAHSCLPGSGHVLFPASSRTISASAQAFRIQTAAPCKIMSFHKRVLRSLGNGPARRSLFGPVDREQLQAEYRDALRKDVEDASRRWGFDFVSEKPLQGGDFQWEGVPGARVPALYRSCIAGEEPVPQREESTSAITTTTGPTRPTIGKENVPTTPERYSGAPQNLEKTPEKNNPLKRKQTNITDFYQAKRRVVATPRKSGQ